MPLPSPEDAGKNLLALASFLGFVGKVYTYVQSKRGEAQEKEKVEKAASLPPVVTDAEQIAAEREENRKLRADLDRARIEHDADRDRWTRRLKSSESEQRRLSTLNHDLRNALKESDPDHSLLERH